MPFAINGFVGVTSTYPLENESWKGNHFSQLLFSHLLLGDVSLFSKSLLCALDILLPEASPGPSEGRYLENLIYHGTQLDTINEAVGLAQVTGRGSMFSSASSKSCPSRIQLIHFGKGLVVLQFVSHCFVTLTCKKAKQRKRWKRRG